VVVIEGLAPLVVIWRFTGTRTRSPSAESQARRAVALSFFVLAPYIVAEAIRDLLGHHAATPGVLGMAITASSLVFMPALGLVKGRLGTCLDSGATNGEGVQNLLCAAWAAAVLAGLAVTAASGWDWLDPAIAVAVAAVAVREGVTTWRGTDCC
jgi:divalent metal cation (Fe/Co/Zn/Cd) transporter